MSDRQLPDGLRRLSILAKYLEGQLPKMFDLLEWDCGTAACAVGHATACPALKAEGLRLETARMLSFVSQSVEPVYRHLRSWSAAGEFFEIDLIEVKYLFSAEAYHVAEWNDPRAVAGRIRAFLASKTSVDA